MVGHGTQKYVLIAGAFHGGWVWGQVAARIRAAGYEATTPTLTGLGERRHIGQEVDLSLHVEDVIAHIEMEGLSNVTLVGWSYGGMVTTGVLARVPEKIGAMIYLDAFVPEDGKAVIDYVAPEARASWDQYRETDAPLPPLSPEMLGLADPMQIDFVRPRLTPQPWRTFFQPVKALKQRPTIPTAYIKCIRNPASHFNSALEEVKKDQAVRIDKIDAGHSCMITEPAETAKLLLKYGA
jgi:pimeloyl-ACP methyl ester carboxylesterase